MLRDRFDRILYLDVDTYPETGKIFDLFGLDLGSHPIAAVRDLIVPFWPNADNQGELRNTLGASGLGAKYLNSGVLLFDLARWSDRQLERKALKLIHSRRVPLRYPDQSVFNAILLMDWLELSPSFNMVTRAWASFIRVFAPPQIVHFTGPINPGTPILWIHTRPRRKFAPFCALRAGRALVQSAQDGAKCNCPSGETRHWRRSSAICGGRSLRMLNRDRQSSTGRCSRGANVAARRKGGIQRNSPDLGKPMLRLVLKPIFSRFDYGRLHRAGKTPAERRGDYGYCEKGSGGCAPSPRVGWS